MKSVLEVAGVILILIGVLNFAIPQGNRRGGLTLVVTGIVCLGIALTALRP